MTLNTPCQLARHRVGRLVGWQQWDNGQLRSYIGQVAHHDPEQHRITIRHTAGTTTTECGHVWAAGEER